MLCFLLYFDFVALSALPELFLYPICIFNFGVVIALLLSCYPLVPVSPVYSIHYRYVLACNHLAFGFFYFLCALTRAITFELKQNKPIVTRS